MAASSKVTRENHPPLRSEEGSCAQAREQSRGATTALERGPSVLNARQAHSGICLAPHTPTATLSKLHDSSSTTISGAMKTNMLAIASAVVAAIAVLEPSIAAEDGNYLRHLEETTPKEPHEATDGATAATGGDGEQGYANREVYGCYPGSWNWPHCRDGGYHCYPGSWNWPHCHDGGYHCYPGSWNWPRCRYGHW